uniref:Uncharacterized protein n=1 Tax=Romanomermis culicivorax TaxID=13658 RepID=A0A915I8E8_ROMCU
MTTNVPEKATCENSKLCDNYCPNFSFFAFRDIQIVYKPDQATYTKEQNNRLFFGRQNVQSNMIQVENIEYFDSERNFHILRNVRQIIIGKVDAVAVAAKIKNFRSLVAEMFAMKNRLIADSITRFINKKHAIAKSKNCTVVTLVVQRVT